MNINEAYEFIMNKLEELRQEGMVFELREPSKNKEAIEKYNKPNRLPENKWQIIIFTIGREGDLKKVFDVEHLCKMVGINFDTGYGSYKRDWYLDWSMRID